MVMNLMRNRRSIRVYRTEPVPGEKVAKILEAGRLAPSGANRQPWVYIVVDDEALKGEIRKRSEEADSLFHKEAPDWLKNWLKEEGITTTKQFLTDAPFLVVVAGNTKAPYWLESTWISIAYMILLAEKEGVGTLTYTPGNTEPLNKLLNLPKDYEVVAILPIGFPAETLPPEKRPRRPLAQIAFHNRHGINLPQSFGSNLHVRR